VIQDVTVPVSEGSYTLFPRGERPARPERSSPPITV